MNNNKDNHIGKPEILSSLATGCSRNPDARHPLQDSDSDQYRNLMDQYHVLPEPQKTMLRIIAVNVDHCFQYELLECMKHLGLYHKSRKDPTPSVLKSYLKNFAEKGLSIKISTGLFIPEPIRKKIVADLIYKKEFIPLALAVQKGNPATPHAHTRKNFRSFKLALRELQFHIFTGQPMPAIMEILDNMHRIFPIDNQAHPRPNRLLNISLPCFC